MNGMECLTYFLLGSMVVMVWAVRQQGKKIKELSIEVKKRFHNMD